MAQRCLLLLLGIWLLLVAEGRSDERLKGIACRSVHLGYAAPAGLAFTTEVTVEKSAPGTYFMACGWSKGYFGMQELGNGKKLVIFSVWDPTQGDDPRKVMDEKRVKMLYKDPEVRVGRFGGEGTGGQSFFDYDWKVGETYRFLVTAKVEGPRTAYAGYFYVPEKKAWKHLVTFSTLAEGQALTGYYSFVEDFRRDRVSTTRERRAQFGSGWVRSKDGHWVALTRARFTADANPVLNIDAGLQGERFFLATGGEITNKGTPLGKTIERLPTGLTLPRLP
ncbi:MAG: DUF3472 domain-containing protein [Gemmataceae bacterium]